MGSPMSLYGSETQFLNQGVPDEFNINTNIGFKKNKSGFLWR